MALNHLLRFVIYRRIPGEYVWFVFIILLSLDYQHNATACKQPCMLVSNTTNILSIDINNGAVSSVSSGLTRAVAVGFDFQTGHVYWSDVAERKIKRTSVSGGNSVTVIQGIGTCDGLAIEWRSRLLYWSDVTFDRIEVAKLNGTDRSVLISTGLSQPRAVAVDPEAGFLFWTDWGSLPKIERSTLSGEQRLTIVSSNLKWPNGLTVDFGSKSIYWIDSFLDKIETSDYQGNGRRLVSNILGTHAFGLVLYGSDLFWSNWAVNNNVRRVNKNNGQAIQSYSVKGKQPMGITIFDQTLQPRGASKCGTRFGGCSHLCLQKPGAYVCACPTGYKLNSDGKTCAKGSASNQQSFFLVATQTKIFRVDYETSSSHALISGLRGNLAIDVDVNNRHIYWSNRGNRAIFRADIDGTNAVRVIDKNIGMCGGLAVEWRSNLLYWTDATFDKIEVASLNGQNRRVLFDDDLIDPWGIVVEPDAGYLFWTTVNGIRKIERSTLSGKNRKRIITTVLLYPTGITIDYATRRIYWLDGFLKKIEYADYDGKNRNSLEKKYFTYFSAPSYLTVKGAFVYWTDRGMVHTISKIPKEAGKRSGQRLFPLPETPFGITEFSVTRQKKGQNQCILSTCSHLCLLEPRGPVCACPDGFFMSSDQKTCQSANEIPEFFMVIQKKSRLLTLHSPDGRSSLLQLIPEGEAITAVDYNPIGRNFIFAHKRQNGGSIEIISIQSSQLVSGTIFACNVKRPESLTVDWRGENVYWTDSQKGTIEVVQIKGKFRKVLHKNLDTPKAIALQPDLGLMLWSECGALPRIMLSNMDGTKQRVLISSGITCAYDLVFDYPLKKFYWRNSLGIEMSNLDGSSRQTVLQITGITGFALTNRNLYWSEASGAVYLSSRTGGSRVKIASNLQTPQVIKAYAKHSLSHDVKIRLVGGSSPERGQVEVMYNGAWGRICDDAWDKKDADVVCRMIGYPGSQAASFGGSFDEDKVKVWLDDVQCIGNESSIVFCKHNGWGKENCDGKEGAGVICLVSNSSTTGNRTNQDPSTSESYPSSCSQSNGHCSQLCLTHPKGSTCACSNEYRLQEDNKSCVFTNTEGSLLIANSLSYLTRLPLSSDRFTCSEKVLDNRRALAVAYDPKTEYIYWSEANFIFRAKMKSGKQTLLKNNLGLIPVERVAVFQNSQPNWLVLDWISGNLFWTFLKRRNIIGVSRADGSSKKTLISDASNVGQIAINPIKGILYWVERGKVPKIMMSSMNGDTKKAIVQTGLKVPIALAVDHFNHRVFWIDSGTQKIEQSDFEGKNRILIVQLPDKIPRWGLVYFNNSLYWTNPNKESIEGVDIISRQMKTLTTGIGRTSYALAVQSISLKQGTNKCERINGGCSNLCFPAVYGRDCACPDGVKPRADDLTTCEGVNRCPSLQSPPHGTKRECRNVPGISCSFSCDNGFYLVGSEVRTCLHNGSWSGVQPLCKRVMCSPIQPPKYGSMDGPSACNKRREVPYNSYCVFRCSRKGFVRQGPRATRCQLNGTWSVNSSSVLCKDQESPKVICPKDVKLLTDLGKPTALYNWTMPEGKDNSGDPVTVRVQNPRIVSPYHFPYGQTIVRYTAEDSFQLKGYCSFEVEVKDAEPPQVEYCPNDYKIISTTRFTNVTLPNVKFTDNVRVNRISYVGLANGSAMLWGKHSFRLTAFDKDQNNASCSFNMEIMSKQCHLDPPLHGAISCETWLEGGRYCSIHCNKGFAFAVKVEDIYFCDGKGAWRNVPKQQGQPKLPDCSPTKKQKAGSIRAAVRYKTESCYDTKAVEKMKAEFINKFKTHLFGLLGGCFGNEECKVENVEVVCHRETTKSRLKRRSTANYVLTIKFEFNFPAGNESFVKTNETNSTSEVLNATASAFVNIVQTVINSSSLDINVGNKTLQASREGGVSVKDIGVKCNPGQKRVGRKCVSCPVGTYHNTTNDTCVTCPVDSYQDQEGQLSCKTCPTGTSTWGVEGARWVEYCTACIDRFRESETGDCDYWKKQGYCETDKFVMATYCPLSCGFCGTCSELDQPEGMLILPPTCGKKRVSLGTSCNVFCDKGYKLTAKSKPLACRSDGTWSSSVWDYKCSRVTK